MEMKRWTVHRGTPGSDYEIAGANLEEAVNTNMQNVLIAELPGEYAKRSQGSRYAAVHSADPTMDDVKSVKIAGMEYRDGILGGKGGVEVTLLVDTGGIFGPQQYHVWVYADADMEPCSPNESPQQRYEKKVIVPVSIRLNRKTDADILEWLDAHDGGNRQGYIKALIRAKIKREGGNV